MAKLVGRLNLEQSPPTIEEIQIFSSNLDDELPNNWVYLGHKFDGNNYSEGFTDICRQLIYCQDYKKWMEPLLDRRIIVECLKLQGIKTEGIGL